MGSPPSHGESAMKRLSQSRCLRTSTSNTIHNVRKHPAVLAAALLSSAAVAELSVSPVRAADFSWSADGQTPAGGGHGAWNTTDLRWWDGANFHAWPNTTADGAIFGSGGRGSLLVPALINAQRLVFHNDYRLYVPQLGPAATNIST